MVTAMPIRADVHRPAHDQHLGPRPVSPWVKAAAYAVPLCVLPSALWRLHAVFVTGVPLGCERFEEGQHVRDDGVEVDRAELDR